MELLSDGQPHSHQDIQEYLNSLGIPEALEGRRLYHFLNYQNIQGRIFKTDNGLFTLPEFANKTLKSGDILSDALDRLDENIDTILGLAFSLLPDSRAGLEESGLAKDIIALSDHSEYVKRAIRTFNKRAKADRKEAEEEG